MDPEPSAIADPQLLRAAGGLRAVSAALEAGLFLVVAGSAAAFGAVHPESYRWVWLGGLLLGALALVRAGLAARLRRARGWHRIALDGEGRWRDLAGVAHEPRWYADLSPLRTRAPLLLPGACFAAWTLLQLVPLPPALLRLASPARAAFAAAPAGAWLPLTVSPAETRRGLAFVAVALLVHLAAAAASAGAGARRRLFRGLALLGLAISLVGLAQLSLGSQRIYGLFAPLEGSGTIFGPFVNRNHFAGYLLMVIPAAIAVAASALRRVARGPSPGRRWRHFVLALDSPAGVALMYWTVPVLATTAALFATHSRGGVLAFLCGLAVLAVRLRRGAVLWVAGLAGLAALSALGFERLQERFVRAPHESLGRTLVWKDALERSRPFRAPGTGFNTYATALNRSDAWALPEGATPWPPGGSPSELLGPRSGYRIYPGGTDDWYRELHNDYLQVLIESGVPGLLLALWAALAALAAAREDPWVLAALVGVLFHELVDFDLQIPALALLFVTLAASARRRTGAGLPSLDPSNA